MNEHELMRYWEERLNDAETNLRDHVPGSLKESAYWRDVVPYKHILRVVRLKAGILICSGAVDCLDAPETVCSSGQHSTCAKHKSSCYLCGAKPNESPGS